MLKRLIALALAACFVAGTAFALDQPAPDAAEHRTALVIGNSAYENVPLNNPANDARSMSQTLRSLGFEVSHLQDADLATMRQAVEIFGQNLQRGGVGLFYYAGHGVQIRGVNYLIPVGAGIECEEQVAGHALDANEVFLAMRRPGNPMNIIILDACRDNPFGVERLPEQQTRSITPTPRPMNGLARMDAPAGSLVAYSTGPGNVALDGEGGHSPYTSALVENIVLPGLTIERVFKNVRISVDRATNGRQIPWESTSLTGEFYFAGTGAVPTAPVAEQQPAPEPEPERGQGPDSGWIYLGIFEDGLWNRNVIAFDEPNLPPEGLLTTVAENGVVLREEPTFSDVIASPNLGTMMDSFLDSMSQGELPKPPPEPPVAGQAVGDLNQGEEIRIVAVHHVPFFDYVWAEIERVN